MIPQFQSDGYLPSGRYAASIEEIKDRLVTDDVRSALWADWEALYEVLVSVVGRVEFVWFGGSFVSSKSVPGDIDSVFFISASRLTDHSEDNKKFLAAVANSQVKSLGLKVDSYIVVVEPPDDPDLPVVDSTEYNYLLWRGYWDNIWSSRRGGALNGSSRGYLEVVPDDSI